MLIIVIVGGLSTYGLLWSRRFPSLEDAVATGVTPRLFPEYAGVTIPPNIAPMNFIIEEPGDKFAARLFDGLGELLLETAARHGRIQMPKRAWRRALDHSRGGIIRVETYVRDTAGNWLRFDPVTFSVSSQPIDEYLVYRRIHPGYNYWGRMAICQRKITGFEERKLFRNEYLGGMCMNCHTHSAGHESLMLMQIRHLEKGPSMVVASPGAIKNVDARTDERPETPTYADLHPDGDLIAISQNRISQFFHTGAERAEPRHVVDSGGDLAVVRITDGVVSSSPQIARPDRLNTYPRWSADGRHLYFSSAVVPWESRPLAPEDGYQYWQNIYYDLARVSFDLDTLEFGEVEIILDHKVTGRSMTQPSPCPTGHRLVFVGHDSGSFPIFQESADLWIMDLDSGEARPMNEINSNHTDTWPGWSQNGLWLLFSSKRKDGLLSRPYFSYIGTGTNPARPFVLPQRDPAFYLRDYENFNVPILSPHPMPLNASELRTVIDAVTKATPRGEAQHESRMEP